MLSARLRSKPAGFTLIELLISLAIMAVLLAAVAVAFDATMTNYTENEKTFKAINAARQALVRMTNDIRTGLVDPNNVANQQLCEIVCSDGRQVRYHHDSANDRLLLYDYNTAADYVLCEDVSNIIFIKDNSTPTGDVKSVRISITLADDDFEQKLSAAAVVRKVLER